MAGFAASRSTIRASLLHSFFELAFVRIEMATCTRQLVPVVHDCLRFKAIALFVAIAAGDCRVPASQNEFRRLVLRKGKCRRFVSLQVVAALTSIQVRGSGKLSRMFVGMAIGTALKLDFEESVFAFRNVASRTLHLGVSALKWIGRGDVILYGEC